MVGLVLPLGSVPPKGFEVAARGRLEQVARSAGVAFPSAR